MPRKPCSITGRALERVDQRVGVGVERDVREGALPLERNETAGHGVRQRRAVRDDALLEVAL